MILAFLLGVVAGVVAGLVPGIHINLIASLVLTGSGWLLQRFLPRELAVFVVVMGVTHTFVELVPTIFLGAPDDSTALVMLPGHRMLHDGLGYDAVRFAVIGAFGCLLGALALVPAVLWLFPLLVNWARPVLGWLLLALVAILLAKEGRDWWKATLVFSLTGTLGWVVLNGLQLEQPLLPLLSGLFGASSLSLSLIEKTAIPVQIGSFERLKKRDAAKGIVGGLLGGTLVTLFPGLGPGHAGALATTLFRSTSHSYLVLAGGLHAADFIASLATLVAVGKARNGALAVLDQLVHIGRADLVLLGGIALAAGIIAAGLALLSAKGFSELVERVNYQFLCAGVLSSLVVLVTLISGWKGLLVLIASTAFGVLAPLLRVSRSHAMGCLLIPTIIYYL